LLIAIVIPDHIIALCLVDFVPAQVNPNTFGIGLQTFRRWDGIKVAPAANKCDERNNGQHQQWR
jgi:hypothetical protein